MYGFLPHARLAVYKTPLLECVPRLLVVRKGELVERNFISYRVGQR
jgi:hypothetical protein